MYCKPFHTEIILDILNGKMQIKKKERIGRKEKI